MFGDGAEQKLETIQPGQLGKNYQRIRNVKGTFTFDGERDALGFVVRLAPDFKQRQASLQRDRIRHLEQW